MHVVMLAAAQSHLVPDEFVLGRAFLVAFAHLSEPSLHVKIFDGRDDGERQRHRLVLALRYGERVGHGLKHSVEAHLVPPEGRVTFERAPFGRKIVLGGEEAADGPEPVVGVTKLGAERAQRSVQR